MPGSLLDSGIWLAALFPSHPGFRKATAVIQDATPSVPACFCRSTELSFLRLATTAAILRGYGAPTLSNRDALHSLDRFLSLPQVRLLAEPHGTSDLSHHLASLDTASPKVWMDAYLAAFAISGNLRLVTFDRDFLAYRTRGLDVELLSVS